MQTGRFDHAGRFNLLIIFLLSLSLATPLIRGLGYSVPDFPGGALFTSAAVLMYALIHSYPLPALSLAAILAAAAALSRRAFPTFLAKISGALPVSREPEALFWPLLIIAALSLLLYVLVFSLKRPLLPLMIIGLCCFVPLWYLYIDSAYPAALAYATGWFILLSYRTGAGLWEKAPQEQKGGERLRRSWIRYTFFILAPALLLALLLPKNFAPLNWPALHNWGRGTFSFLNELRSDEGETIRGKGEEFGFSASSFRETSRLDEPLSLDPTVLLEVRGRGGLYLKGSIFDAYRGKSWVNTGDPEVPALFTPPPPALSHCLAAVDLRIIHRRLRTKTIFSIQYPLELSGLLQPLQADRNGALTLYRSLPLGQEYGVKGFIQVYRADIAALEVEETLPPDLELYLELPWSLPPRVRRLALEITAGRRGHYDKMKALESYLRRNYTYHSETPSLTAGMDFVDSFLFETGTGYCTYFATALAVMGRMAGVPTRYVIGFRVPEIRGAGGIYEVAGTDAHAWVEGYIPGVGWLPFEPTPGFGTSDSLPLRMSPENGAAPPPPVEMERPPTPPGDAPRPDPGHDHEGPPAPAETYLKAAWILNCLSKVFLPAALAAPVVFLLFMLLRYREIRKEMERLKEQKARLQAVTYYNLALSLQERLGAGKYPGETPLEYSRRIIRDVYTWDLNFNEISEGINLALYSKEGGTAPALAEQAGQFFHLVFNRYLARVGRCRALFEILLQGKYFKNISRGPFFR